MSSNNFSWLCCNKTPEKRTILQTVLPPRYKYKITSFKLLHESDVHNESKFEAVLTVNICQEEEIKQFILEFEKSSSTSYNQLHGDQRLQKNPLCLAIENVTIISENVPNQEIKLILILLLKIKQLENKQIVLLELTLS